MNISILSKETTYIVSDTSTTQSNGAISVQRTFFWQHEMLLGRLGDVRVVVL